MKKLVCKQKMKGERYVVGKSYKLHTENNEIWVFDENMTWTHFCKKTLNEYFCTKKQLRLMKLKQLEYEYDVKYNGGDIIIK